MLDQRHWLLHEPRMCGRYSLYSDPETLADHFGLDEIPDWSPRYNMAPSTAIPAIGLSREGRRGWSTLRWGLIPPWARDAAIGHKMINARAETIADKPAFRRAFHERRCLIPANGFFEWRQRDETREPWYIHRRDDAPMAFAGLWELWTERESGERVASCTIVTTEASDRLACVHHRMPVIIPAPDYDRWLERGDALPELLAPAADLPLEIHRVDPQVNSPRHDTAECVRPVQGAAD